MRMFLVYSMSVRVCVSCVSVQGYLLPFARHAHCRCAALTCDLRGGAHDNGKRRGFAGCVGVPVPFASVRGQWCAVRRRVLWTTRQLQRDAQRGGCSATTLPPPTSTSSVRCSPFACSERMQSFTRVWHGRLGRVYVRVCCGVACRPPEVAVQPRWRREEQVDPARPVEVSRAHRHGAGTGTHNAMAHVANRWVGAVQVEPSPQLLWRDRGVGRDLDHVASHRVSMGPPRYSITSYQAHMGDGTLASRWYALLVHSQLSSGLSRSRYFCALCLGYGSCAVGMSGWCSLHHVSPCRSHCSKPRLTNGGETW